MEEKTAIMTACIFYLMQTQFLVLSFSFNKILSSFKQNLMQTQIIAAAAAGVAAEGLSPKDAKAEAENAAQLSVALVENAIVILMLVEDHLRLQNKQSSSARAPNSSPSPLSVVYATNNHSNPLSTIDESTEVVDDRRSLDSDSGGVPLDVCIQ